MKPYREQFPVGATVRIAERAELERFRREWQFHHKLEEQPSYAGQTAGARFELFVVSADGHRALNTQRNDD